MSLKCFQLKNKDESGFHRGAYEPLLGVITSHPSFPTVLQRISVILPIFPSYEPLFHMDIYPRFRPVYTLGEGCVSLI